MNKGALRGQHAERAPAAGALLGYVDYKPATLADYSTTSTTYADLDATNLAVTFVGPSTGKVVVRLFACIATAGSGTYYSWNLRDSAGDIANTVMRVESNTATTGIETAMAAATTVNVVPGQLYTWKWGHARDFATTGTPHTFAGGSAKQAAVMEVRAAA